MQRCQWRHLANRGGLLGRSPPRYFWGWWRERRERSARTASSRRVLLEEYAQGLGGGDLFTGLGQRQNTSTGAGSTQADADKMDHETVMRGLSAGQGLGGGSATKEDLRKLQQDIDDILENPGSHLTGRRRQPISYDLQVRRQARVREAEEKARAVQHSKFFDELNMPRQPHDPQRERASWEYIPTPEHRSLVLTLYRNVLKGLIDFKSIRRRSLIAYTRMCFRRRAQATEKLLIDECIEECRRALYVLEKHRQFTTTQSYEFDSMFIPKDTGQDVKKYMEEVYDPQVSRQQFQDVADVQPGQEHLHQQGLGPHNGMQSLRGQNGTNSFKVQIRDEDKVFRPPPPPT